MPGMKHSRLQDAVAVATVGDRPFAKRAFSKAVLPTALAAMVAVGVLASPPASAQFYGSSANTSARVYGANQALEPSQVVEGRVVAVRQVEVRDNRNTAGIVIGAAAGSAIGYAAASRHHHYYASGIASMVGGLVGSVVGSRIESSMEHRQAVEVFVEIDQNGRRQVLASVQDNDQPGIYPGAEVLVTRGVGGFRIIPAQGADMPPPQEYQGRDYQGYPQPQQPGVYYTPAPRPRW